MEFQSPATKPLATMVYTVAPARAAASCALVGQQKSVRSTTMAASRPNYGSTVALRGTNRAIGFSNSVAGATLEMNRATATSAAVTAPRRLQVSMAKKVAGMIKLALEAGKASPAPPVGPALGAKGVNIMAFCKEYNAKTQDKAGFVIPVEITVYDDRSFTFIMKTPPASILLKKAAGITSGSGDPKRTKVGTVTMAQVREIAETKMPDLNANDIDAAMKIVMGTANNMGIDVTE